MVTSETLLPSNTDRKPIVAIVGAGIAGLTLAILLDRQGVEYQIYERASELKPMGAAMSLGANVTPLFKQLGLYDEFRKVAKAWYEIKVYNNKGEFEKVVDISPLAEMAGDDSYVITRPALHDFLLRQVSREKVHLRKRLLSFTQSEHGVMIRTSDNQTHEADILIGADGAHSAVRQRLFEHLKSERKLPASDNVPLPFTTICLVGQTEVLDPEEFPSLKLKEALFVNVDDPESPFSASIFTTAQNTMCWNVIQHLNEKTAEQNDNAYRNSEWGPEAAEAMCNEVRDIVIPGPAPDANPWVLGDLIDRTPKGQISKVMLEEKVFDTWHSGRTVLIGDACHKISPSSGHGAVNAIHDAISIANWISVLPSTKLEDVENIFRQFNKERYPPAKASYKSSKIIVRAGGSTLEAKILRGISNHMPAWLMKFALSKTAGNRPQVSFLPQVEDKGTVKTFPQPSLDKTLAIHKARQNIKEHGATKVV